MVLDQEALVEQAEGESIGIIGGTFDPVHYAHLAIAEEVRCALNLARIVFVPAGQPPHKTEQCITPVEHRVAMLRLAIASNPHFVLSLVDAQRGGPSYTVDTLRLLRRELGPRADLYFVIGSDSLEDLPTWYDSAGILAQATIVALIRPGYNLVPASREQLDARLPGLMQRLVTLEGPRMDISSTDLRRRVAEGRPIAYQVPEEVADYILQHRLYTDEPAGERRMHMQGDAHATNAI